MGCGQAQSTRWARWKLAKRFGQVASAACAGCGRDCGGVLACAWGVGWGGWVGLGESRRGVEEDYKVTPGHKVELSRRERRRQPRGGLLTI